MRTAIFFATMQIIKESDVPPSFGPFPLTGPQFTCVE